MLLHVQKHVFLSSITFSTNRTAVCILPKVNSHYMLLHVTLYCKAFWAMRTPATKTGSYLRPILFQRSFRCSFDPRLSYFLVTLFDILLINVTINLLESFSELLFMHYFHMFVHIVLQVKAFVTVCTVMPAVELKHVNTCTIFLHIECTIQLHFPDRHPHYNCSS